MVDDSGRVVAAIGVQLIDEEEDRVAISRSRCGGDTKIGWDGAVDVLWSRGVRTGNHDLCVWGTKVLAALQIRSSAKLPALSLS